MKKQFRFLLILLFLAVLIGLSYYIVFYFTGGNNFQTNLLWFGIVGINWILISRAILLPTKKDYRK